MKEVAICVICGNESQLIYQNYPGYVEGTSYNIYHCNECNVNFIFPPFVDKDLYRIIYSNEIYGYDRYLDYAINVKNSPNPLEYLMLQESTYYPVFEYLKEKSNLNILEVGCGYGYLSYAMRQQGHSVTAIDISQPAIDFAVKNFGDYFHCTDLHSFIAKDKGRFDLIVATELIEHLSEPLAFVKQCSSVLADNGRILLTTPNKDFMPAGTVWQTDLPPVHISWLSTKGIKKIAERIGLSAEFIKFNRYYPSTENRLIKHIRSRKEFMQTPLITRDGKSLKEEKHSAVHNRISSLLHRFAPVRLISNKIYNVLFSSDNTLGVILQK